LWLLVEIPLFFLTFFTDPQSTKDPGCEVLSRRSGHNLGSAEFLFGKVVPKFFHAQGDGKMAKKKESVEGMTIFHKRTLFQHLCDEGFFRSRQLQVKTCERKIERNQGHFRLCL